MVLSGLILLGLVGCGTESEPPGPAEPVVCAARFTVAVDGGCAPVAITGVVEEPVSFERDGFVLHGTLSIPQSEVAYAAPAAVIVHGSGPIDRDGRLPGSLGVPFPAEVRAYASLARQLSERGFLVLRYDKRSCFAENNPGCSGAVADYPGDVHALVPSDFAEDARAAIRFVAARPEARPDDVLLLGHSQGGSFVPRLVAEEPAASGGVGLASPSLGLSETVGGQLDVLADHLEAQDPALFADDIAQLRALADEYRQGLEQIEAGSYPGAMFLGAPVAFWQDWAGWHDAHQGDFAANEAPLLLLSGDLDFNVWPAHLAQYAAWAEALDAPDVTTWLVPGLTHALVPIVSGTPPLDHQIDPEVSAEVVAAIADWAAARGAR